MSPNTKVKTDADIAHFSEYLIHIRKYHDSVENLPEDKLSEYLCDFLSGIKKKKDGSNYQPDSLWSLYASVKRYLVSKDYHFSSSPPLPKVTQILKCVSKNLKKEGFGDLPNRSEALTSEEIDALYESRVAGYHNPVALNTAIAITCMFLGFRAYNELYRRCLGDMKIITINGKRFLTVVKERITKTRNGNNILLIQLFWPPLQVPYFDLL